MRYHFPSVSRTIKLRSGAALQLWGKRGTVVVCIEGRVRRNVELTGAEQAWPCTVQVIMHAGESYLCEQGALELIVAESTATLLCIESMPRWRVWGQVLLQSAAKCAMIPFIRRGVEQSGSSSGS